MNYDNQITEILEEIDFDRIHQTKVALNWWPINGVGELRANALDLLERAAKAPEDVHVVECMTGGFRATRTFGCLRLAFEIDSWGFE